MSVPKLLRNIIVASSLFLTIGCYDTRKTTYFNDLPDSDIESQVQNIEPIIQKNDLLSISVNSLNEEATKLFNKPNQPLPMSTGSGANNMINGYLVNQEGYIIFPQLGKVKALGLTQRQFEENLTRQLTDLKLLVEPIVNVRFLNFKVTVLGEVGHPSVINIPNEKVTMLEALGLAGDITIYGRRDNVMLIREVEGKKIVRRLDLNSTALFTSPYYYLKSNDVVYVEASKTKVASVSRSFMWIPVLVSTASLLIVIIDHVN